jgi:hypothetical protein
MGRPALTGAARTSFQENSMPQNLKSTIAQQLNLAQVAINNTIGDSEIQGLVAAFGYTAAKMKEGQAAYKAAITSVNAQTAGEGAQKTATAKSDAAKETAILAYQSLAKVARAIFGSDKAKLATLGLTGGMPLPTAEFITAGYSLFDNAAGSAEIKSALSGYSYNDAKLAAERAKLAAFDTSNQAQEAAMGSAQQSTQEQLIAMRNMNAWVNQYLKIAKVALHDKPQLLEKLGIGSRSSKTKAQRGASAKAAATRKAKKASKPS